MDDRSSGRKARGAPAPRGAAETRSRLVLVPESETVGRNGNGDAAELADLAGLRDELRASDARWRLAAVRAQSLYEQLVRADEERRRLLETVAEVERTERRQLAEDLHDDPIQVITAAVLRLQLVRRHPDREDIDEHLAEVEGILQHAVARLRRLTFELRPASLEEDGLAAVIRSLLATIHEEDGIRCRLQDHLATLPSPAVAMTLYRIAREAVVNARKHAHAGRVDVLLSERDRGYLVRVRDDGSGFDAREPARIRRGHLGFRAMRERAELAGGWWRVDSAPGEGTVVEFWVPTAPHRETDPA
jgi:signal transduction histidine kinase